MFTNLAPYKHSMGCTLVTELIDITEYVTVPHQILATD